MASLNTAIDSSSLPFHPPPPGITANYVNPESQGGLLVGIGLTFLSLTICLVAMRLYTKVFIARRWDLEDATCVLGLVGSIGFTAVGISMLKYGVGIHIWDLAARTSLQATALIVRNYIILIIYPPTMLMVKLSLLLLYLQIFRSNVTLRYFIYFGIVFVSLFYPGVTIATLILSTPKPGQSWFAGTQNPRFIKNVLLGVVQSTVNVVSDFYILCLPIQGIWKLQLPIQKKVGVSAIFLTGFFACIASILTFVYRIQASHSSDTTWGLVPSLALSAVELDVGIMCSCMPAFAKFFHHHSALPRLLSSALDFVLNFFNRFITPYQIPSKRGPDHLGMPTARHPLTVGTALENAQSRGIVLSRFQEEADLEPQRSSTATQDLELSDSRIKAPHALSLEVQRTEEADSRPDSGTAMQAPNKRRCRYWWEAERIISDVTLSQTSNRDAS